MEDPDKLRIQRPSSMHQNGIRRDFKASNMLISDSIRPRTLFHLFPPPTLTPWKTSTSAHQRSISNPPPRQPSESHCSLSTLGVPLGRKQTHCDLRYLRSRCSARHRPDWPQSTCTWSGTRLVRSEMPGILRWSSHASCGPGVHTSLQSLYVVSKLSKRRLRLSCSLSGLLRGPIGRRRHEVPRSIVCTPHHLNRLLDDAQRFRSGRWTRAGYHASATPVWTRTVSDGDCLRFVRGTGFLRRSLSA